MDSPALHVVIDARPRGPRGVLAAETILGRPILDHLVEHALAVTGTILPNVGPIPVHAREEEQGYLASLLAERHSGRVVFASGPPRADTTVLRTDRIYDRARLGRALRRGRDPESAAIWRLDRPETLALAGEELSRRLTYQPLGRYWAFTLAERMAEVLRPTRVRPNALTLVAAALMITAAGIVAGAPSGWVGRIATASALAFALVLDTADGRLARLQGTSSAFGRWLDNVLDELADIALHGAIAWAMYLTSGRNIWLILGMGYIAGKYLYLVQSIAGEVLEREIEQKHAISDAAVAQERDPCSIPQRLSFARKLIGAIGHADLRWHLWIILALMGHLEYALLGYTVYFPIRTLGGAVRKAVAHV